jgi:hypothetical protein
MDQHRCICGDLGVHILRDAALVLPDARGINSIARTPPPPVHQHYELQYNLRLAS